MKIKSIKIQKFRRFHELSIPDLPPAKLVVMAGPNGSGKSSLFDAFLVWKQSRHFGMNWDYQYYERKKENNGWKNQVDVQFYDGEYKKNSIYIRSAYRSSPEFEIKQLSHQVEPSETLGIRRMIDVDGKVRDNYALLASNAFESAFSEGEDNTTLKQFREDTVGEIGRAVHRLFPELSLNTLGNPLADGTFRFKKGDNKEFSYKNLSGGEKAAFDLLIDIIVKRKSFNDTIYAIDEPEAHMNTRLQGILLTELYELIPPKSQLWIATHSIGMMRMARDLFVKNPDEVIFLDFEGNDYDMPVTLHPVKPTRAFWERILRVALDDLSDLVAPKRIVICEGNPQTTGQRNEAHDAQCYDVIFRDRFPDTKFISGGSSKEVHGDRLKFASVFPQLIKGVEVIRLIDRDDHSSVDIQEMELSGVRVLGRRNLESYLYDDEVLAALYKRENRSMDLAAALEKKQTLLSESRERGNAPDDLKSICGELYVFMKRALQLSGCGNDQMAFARVTLAPLIGMGMTVYDELFQSIFGNSPDNVSEYKNKVNGPELESTQ